MPNNLKSVMGGKMILVHDGKQVVGEEGWVMLEKVDMSDIHNLKGPPTSGGSIDILHKGKRKPKRARLF